MKRGNNWKERKGMQTWCTRIDSTHCFPHASHDDHYCWVNECAMCIQWAYFQSSASVNLNRFEWTCPLKNRSDNTWHGNIINKSLWKRCKTAHQDTEPEYFQVVFIVWMLSQRSASTSSASNIMPNYNQMLSLQRKKHLWKAASVGMRQLRTKPSMCLLSIMFFVFLKLSTHFGSKACDVVSLVVHTVIRLWSAYSDSGSL